MRVARKVIICMAICTFFSFFSPSPSVSASEPKAYCDLLGGNGSGKRDFEKSISRLKFIRGLKNRENLEREFERDKNRFSKSISYDPDICKMVLLHGQDSERILKRVSSFNVKGEVRDLEGLIALKEKREAIYNDVKKDVEDFQRIFQNRYGLAQINVERLGDSAREFNNKWEDKFSKRSYKALKILLNSVVAICDDTKNIVTAMEQEVIDFSRDMNTNTLVAMQGQIDQMEEEIKHRQDLRKNNAVKIKELEETIEKFKAKIQEWEENIKRGKRVLQRKEDELKELKGEGSL